MKVNKLTDERIKNILYVFLLFIITIGIFKYTVRIRKPWFGTLSAGHHQWLSGSTLRFSKNWYRESPLDLKFGMIRNPRSIEFPTLRSRVPHPSYPPGAVLPIYIISKLRGHEPTPSLLMKYNLLNHFFIAFFLSLTVFLFLLQLKFSYLNSFIFSLVPIALELLLPAPLYWHQNVFFADQAVILPFVLFIFLEVSKENIRNKTIANITNVFQILVLFYGILTDWLFVFLALTVYIKRVLNGQMGKDGYTFVKKSVKYWLPVIIVLSLFFLQLYSLGVLPSITHKFMFRTGLGHGGEKYISNFFNKFWNGHIAKGYGKVAIGFLWGSLFLFILSLTYISLRRLPNSQTNKKVKKTLSLIGIVLLPCFMQIYFFRNHSAIHDFSALKFSIPLDIIPFILVPILIFSFFKIDLTRVSLEGLRISYKGRRVDIKLPLIILCIIILVGIYLKEEHPHYKGFFPKPNKSYKEVGKFISTNTQFKDIVFSSNFEIPVSPPQQLSYAMKRVYKVNSIFDVYSRVKNISESYEINIFSVGDFKGKGNDLVDLIFTAYDRRKEDDLYLYKIKKGDFLEKFDEIKKDLLIEVEQVLKNKDIFELYEYKDKYNLIKKIYPEVYRKLNRGYEALLSDYSSKYVVSEKVSFVDYHYKKVDSEKYKFYFVFKVKSGFRKDWKVYFHGHVKGENFTLLPKSRQKYKFDNWGFNPDPPTSVWPEDEYIIITREISAKPIPYNMNIGFYRFDEGRHGKQIKLGWLKLGDKKKRKDTLYCSCHSLENEHRRLQCPKELKITNSKSSMKLVKT